MKQIETAGESKKPSDVFTPEQLKDVVATFDARMVLLDALAEDVKKKGLGEGLGAPGFHQEIVLDDILQTVLVERLKVKLHRLVESGVLKIDEGHFAGTPNEGHGLETAAVILASAIGDKTGAWRNYAHEIKPEEIFSTFKKD